MRGRKVVRYGLLAQRCTMTLFNVGPTRGVFIVANLYPAPLVVASTVALRIDATGRFRPLRSGSMQDVAFGLPRINLPRTPVNKPEIKAGLWRWTSLGLLVPGKYGGIENDRDRQG